MHSSTCLCQWLRIKKSGSNTKLSTQKVITLFIGMLNFTLMKFDYFISLKLIPEHRLYLWVESMLFPKAQETQKLYTYKEMQVRVFWMTRCLRTKHIRFIQFIYYMDFGKKWSKNLVSHHGPVSRSDWTFSYI